MNYLIVGASAVLGHQSIAAILQEDPQAFIIATSSGEAPIADASQTIYGVDLQREDCAASMVAAIGARKIEAVVYVPARGAVGKPVEYATAEEYRASLNFSVVPMLKLMAALKPRLGLWFSGFMWLDCLLALYGPMIYTKITMEELTLRHPDRFKCVRFGMFHSKSSRGIALLAQKSMQQRRYPEMEGFRKAWKESGLKFSEYFAQLSCAEERTILAAEGSFQAPYRSMQESDLKEGVRRALFTDTKPILNLVGDWYWESDALPEWSPAIRKGLSLIDRQLDLFLAE